MTESHRSESTPTAWRVRVPPVVGVMAVVGLFALWLGMSLGGPNATRDFDDLATVGVAAAAAISCGVAARHHDGKARRFWRLLAAALVAWTFGEAAWAYYDFALGGNVPVPSYADIGYIGAIPLAVAALLAHPGNYGSRRMRVRAALDGFVLATALLFLSWTFVLSTVWGDSDVTTGAGLVTLSYPFGDVLIVFLLIRALRWLEGPDRLAFSWILVGLLAMSLSDSGYTYLTAVRGYQTGNLIDIGWFAGYLAIAVGGWYGRQPSRAPRRATSTTTTLGLLTPFLPLLLALGVLTVMAQLGKPIDRMSLVLAFALTGSVLIRQTILILAPAPSLTSAVATGQQPEGWTQ